MATGYLRHFQACNTHDLSKFAPFFIGPVQYGWIPEPLASDLLGNMDMFDAHQNGLRLASRFDDFITRSQALATAASWLATKTGRPLRNEMYPIVSAWGDEPLAQIDRAAVPLFGVRGFGVHVNGFVRKADGIHLWIGERAHDRQVDPGKLDNFIGGGQPIGLSIEDNLCKEAKEEAGIDASLAKTAKRTRDIRYMIERTSGLRNDTLFIFDMELPEGHTPKNTDGEVAAFHLMPIAEVAKIVHDTDRFKFNCNLVIIDFLIRHGFLTEKDGEFSAIKAFLEKPSA
ncbi:MAG TPA: DUF4743 domain-containing protein [Alphaproteobacteria bacterium]|nr:DUF4743 domain-containing protein [Alphaproteobacteria bacterium]